MTEMMEILYSPKKSFSQRGVIMEGRGPRWAGLNTGCVCDRPSYEHDIGLHKSAMHMNARKPTVQTVIANRYGLEHDRKGVHDAFVSMLCADIENGCVVIKKGCVFKNAITAKGLAQSYLRTYFVNLRIINLASSANSGRGPRFLFR